MVKKKSEHTEIEVRFLNIDYIKIVSTLKDLGAKDHGEEFLSEIIFADEALTWPKKDRLIRLRSTSKGTKIAYKHHRGIKVGEVDDVEFDIPDFDKAKAFLELSGFVPIRFQEKKRHTFTHEHFVFDIDTWPHAPTYIEIEAPNEKELKKAAKFLGLDWEKVVHEDAKKLLEAHYNIPVRKLKYFTFEKLEEYSDDK